MTFPKTFLNGTAIVMLGLATSASPILSLAAVAQEADAAPKSAPETEGAAEIAYDDETLSVFVDAAMNIAEVREEYSAKVRDAPDDASRQQLAEEASQEMKSAVENTDGITIEKYVEIGEAADKDEALAERIMALVQKRQPQTTNDG